MEGGARGLKPSYHGKIILQSWSGAENRDKDRYILIECSNDFPKWFTPSLKHKIKCLRLLRKRYSKSPTPHIKDRLQAAEFEAAEEASAAQSAYESKLINDFATTNQPKIFSYIRSLTKSDPIPHTVYYNDNSTTNDKQKAYHCLIITFIPCSLLLILTNPLLVSL